MSLEGKAAYEDGYEEGLNARGKCACEDCGTSDQEWVSDTLCKRCDTKRKDLEEFESGVKDE